MGEVNRNESKTDKKKLFKSLFVFFVLMLQILSKFESIHKFVCLVKHSKALPKPSKPTNYQSKYKCKVHFVSALSYSKVLFVLSQHFPLWM